jgi:outer membrane receptor protein involved in Fe transport
MARGIPISAMVLMMPCALQAQERLVIEEVIVTAQRVEESAQKVPIALNAFDETGIEDRQIIGIGDLSLFVPNLSYNTNNVGDTHVTIRGVGSLVSRRDSESGVSLHVNQVPGVASEIDGRDLYSVRASATWRVTEATEIWGLYERFDEDDDRMLTHNRRCKTALRPTTRTGCEPGEWGLEPNNPNQARFQTSITNGLRGVIPLGARDAETGLTFAYPRPEITNLRDVHIDFAPVYEFEQNLWQLGASHDFDWATLSFIGSYQDWRLRTLQDVDWSVGHELAPIPENPSGLYPVSALPEGKNPLDGPECNVNEAQFGVLGGCVLDPNVTRQFWYGERREWRDFYSAELRLRSDLDGRVNFLIGGNYQFSDDHAVSGGGTNDYWEMWTRFGRAQAPAPGPNPFALNLNALDRLMVLAGGEDKNEFESFSAFSEIYVDLTDHLKLTVAARYNRDEKRYRARGIGAPFDINTGLGGVFGRDVWVRPQAALYIFGISDDSGLLDFYGLTEEVDAALATGGFPGLLAANLIASQIPILTAWNEGAIIAGVPTDFEWDAVSGRAVLDWQITPDMLAYASFARGYKPGGLNGFFSTNPTYDREDVNSFELGFKSLLADDSLMLNVAAFFNDYEGLQLTAELEIGYSWLNAELKNEPPRIDALWLTNGDPEYVELLSFATNAGSPNGRYVARVEDVLPWVNPAIAIGAAIGPDEAPATIYPNGIPAWFDGAFLSAVGVELLPGIPVPVSGNSVPDTPEHTVHLGVSYTWDVPAGALTARWDYYWQSKSYLTIFNRSAETIDAWDQHNLSLIYETGDGRWSARAWVRNIENDLHILGGYRQHSQQDFSVSEPRAFGVSLRFNFAPG